MTGRALIVSGTQGVLVRALLGLPLLTGCSGPPVAAPVLAPVATSAPPPAEEKGVFRSKRFGIKLPIPDPDGWKIDDTTTSWLKAHNEGETSTLLIKLWQADPRMNRDKCEALARTERTLPLREGATLVDSQSLALPKDFDTQADVLMLRTVDAKVFGIVMAFGGWSRRCFAYVYVTEAHGESAGELVGDRLGKFMEGSLQRLGFERDFDVVLERERTKTAPDPGAAPR